MGNQFSPLGENNCRVKLPLRRRDHSRSACLPSVGNHEAHVQTRQRAKPPAPAIGSGKLLDPSQSATVVIHPARNHGRVAQSREASYPKPVRRHNFPSPSGRQKGLRYPQSQSGGDVIGGFRNPRPALVDDTSTLELGGCLFSVGAIGASAFSFGLASGGRRPKRTFIRAVDRHLTPSSPITASLALSPHRLGRV